MKVTLKSPQNLGNKDYPAGYQDVPDSLYANAKFVGLVKSGAATVHPRDEAAQKVQASKDSRALTNSLNAKANHQAIVDGRAGLTNNKSIVGVVKPSPVVEATPVVEAPTPLAQAAPAAFTADVKSDKKSKD
jgi:hypothetical protein